LESKLLAVCVGGVSEGYPKNLNSRYLIDDGIPDYDDVPPWYRGDPEIIERNAQLKARMLKAKTKREEEGE
jgi:hypothetical protein